MQAGVLLCGRGAALVYLQGAVIGALLAVGWAWAGYVRLCELRRQRLLELQYAAADVRQPSTGSIPGARALGALGWPGGGEVAGGGDEERAGSPRPSPGKGWPGVSVVLPVKGCRAHSGRNWRSQLGQHYAGPLEFIFVVDDAADPAVAAVQGLLHPAGHGPGFDASARVITAPHATRCSQKIVNLQAGVRAARPEHKWVLYLDDDIELHPGSLADLVAAAEADPHVFMATGYPLDIPPPGAGLLTYAVLVYHLPLLIGFSLRPRAAFVWGGCMLLPLAHLRADTYGIMASKCTHGGGQAWEHGGYSDDLIVAAQCNRYGLRILCPAFALFPQWLDGAYSPARYWNYLRRQLYVMDTYACAAGRRTNHTMLMLHACLSWAFVAPAVLAALQGFVAAAWLLQGSKAGSYLEGNCARANEALAVYAAAFAAAHCALVWMTSVALQLFAALSPGAPALRAADFSWPRLWAGFLLNNAALPVAAAATLALPAVTWSGVRYRKRGGRVVRVERLAA